MIKTTSDFKTVYHENLRGGDGITEITNFVTPEDLNDKGRLFANITLKPGCSIGYHVHENESELFYLIKGEALYNDNGTECTLRVGDVTICPAGSGHSIANNGQEDLELCAVIVYA